MTLSLPWLTNLFFITIRLGTVLLFTPIQAINQLPIHARLMLILTLSMLLVNYVPCTSQLNNNTILPGVLAECSNGLILATSLYAAFAVFPIAGQIIDNLTGLNSSVLFNPGETTQEPLTGYLLSILAVLFFFSLDGHLWLFKGLAYSFIIIPPGDLKLFANSAPILKQSSLMFSMAFMIASPIVLALLAIDLCGALITRNMPQISIYFLTLPIKILFGLLLLAMMFDFLNPITNKIFSQCFQTWGELMS